MATLQQKIFSELPGDLKRECLGLVLKFPALTIFFLQLHQKSGTQKGAEDSDICIIQNSREKKWG